MSEIRVGDRFEWPVTLWQRVQERFDDEPTEVDLTWEESPRARRIQLAGFLVGVLIGGAWGVIIGFWVGR